MDFLLKLLIIGAAANLPTVWKEKSALNNQEVIHGTYGSDQCSTDELPPDSIDDEDDIDRFCVGEDRVPEEEQRNFCGRLIDGPLTRSEALKVSRRMVELLSRPRISDPGCRITPTLNLAAQRLIEFVTLERYSWLNDDDMPPESDRRQELDQDFCELYSIPTPRRRYSLETMQKIMEMVNRNVSERSIRGKYKWFRLSYVPRMSKCLAANGSRNEKLKMVNDYVLDKVTSARSALLPVHDHNIQQWGQEIAAVLQVDQYFKASRTWILSFKRKYNIVSRAVTSYTSRAEQEQAEWIAGNTTQFRANFSSIEPLFPRRLIWNVDQTGFQYEIVNKRILSWRGERDTILNVDKKNLMTHSYSSQPMISREGRYIGKVLLVMQEPRGEFGPIVGPRVRALERRLGNIIVFASKSGKMSKELTLKWINEVLIPAKVDAMEPDDGSTIIEDSIGTMVVDDEITDDNDNPARPDVLLLLDSWTGHSNKEVLDVLMRNKIQAMVIPKHTTSELQPLDTTFNRQYKKFVKRVLERAAYENMIEKITSREGLIRLHSYVIDQFTSRVYRDMLRYAWRKTDNAFVNEELRIGPPPRMVQELQFEFDRSKNCEYGGCSRKAFVRCSHNGRLVCLHHFMEGRCSRSLMAHILNVTSDPVLAEPAGVELCEEIASKYSQES